MSKSVQVSYTVSCTTQAEYDDLLATLVGNAAFTITAQSEANRTASFEGTYEVA